MRRYTRPGVVRPAGEVLLSAAPSRGSTRIGPLSALGARTSAGGLAIHAGYPRPADAPRRKAGEDRLRPHLDHQTILLRFCCSGEQSPDLRARVSAAEHLGVLLTRQTARSDSEIKDHTPLIAPMQQWANDMQALRFASSLEPPSPLRPLTDFQNGFFESARLLSRAGLPAGHPSRGEGRPLAPTDAEQVQAGFRLGWAVVELRGRYRHDLTILGWRRVVAGATGGLSALA